MRIAVTVIFLQKNRLEGYGQFTNEVFSRLAKQHPEHEFIFLFDRPFDPEFIYAANITPVVVSPAAIHPLAFKYWYDVKAPLALRKYKPDIWIQPYGFCSLVSSVPQLLVLHDLAFLHYPLFLPWYHRWYYRLFTKKFIAKAKGLATVSEFTKADILKNYPGIKNEISVINSAAKNVFHPLPFDEKEKVKEGFADGREYFLFTGGIHPRKNLMNLLKAFSLFKKWQHSNMKLLVAGRLAWQYDDVLAKLKSYKYRDDVVMLNYLPEEQLVKITAAAYAVVYPSFFEGFGLPILQAMQSGVPVITSAAGSMPEVGADAALYANPHEPDAIAKQMLALYRDETLRRQLIDKGMERAKLFNWDITAGLLWETISATVKK